MRDRLARLAQHGHRLQVAAPGRLLDVMGALGGRCAAPGERVGRRTVSRQPPAALRALVHGAPDERVPEREAARHLGRPHELTLEQVVERVEHGRLVHARDVGD